MVDFSSLGIQSSSALQGCWVLFCLFVFLFWLAYKL